MGKNEELWMANLQENWLLSTLSFFLVTSLPSLCCNPEAEQIGITTVLKIGVFIMFWWPLIDGTITIGGIVSRIVLLGVYPFAYSDSVTSAAYNNSSVKEIMDRYGILLFLIGWATMVNGMKSQKKDSEQSSELRNSWAIIGLIVMAILAEKTFLIPIDQCEIPNEFYNTGYWPFNVYTSSFAKTPLLYSLLNKVNFLIT